MGGQVEGAVVVVRHQLNDVVEADRLSDVLYQVDAEALKSGTGVRTQARRDNFIQTLCFNLTGLTSLTSLTRRRCDHGLDLNQEPKCGESTNYTGTVKVISLIGFDLI